MCIQYQQIQLASNARNVRGWSGEERGGAGGRPGRSGGSDGGPRLQKILKCILRIPPRARVLHLKKWYIHRAVFISKWNSERSF